MDPYRKDSVSSEVAALLCISGRTSRISSVGSQGSAVSRLSAISGISRSPSPHKMILETSFCGPKPVDMPLDSALGSGTLPVDALEQILLARTMDPTQAVMAEGITIKALPNERATEKKNGTATKTATSTSNHHTKPRPPVIAPEVKITRPQTTVRAAAATEHKKIVGKTENGTEYIRIKLKPDHLYDDQGLAVNEKLVEDTNADVAARKPASLNINQKTPKGDTQRKPSASPKPSKHIFGGGGGGSRSPSPALALSASRKNSFCSLFKGKDASNLPESPTTGQNRKKSSASARESDDTHNHRSRSCGKIKDMSERLSPSPTPSKQKSVLGLFKTKRSGSTGKSKSSSPVDHEERRVSGAISPIAPNYATQQSSSSTNKPPPRLRYYDPDADNSGIFIPLHTPPEEKDQKLESDAVTRYNQMLDKQLHETELGRSILRSMNKLTPETSPKKQQQAVPPAPHENPNEIVAAPKVSPSTAKKNLDPQLPPKIRKSSRIEYPDGSIRIPLRSFSDEEPPPAAAEVQVQVECVPAPPVPVEVQPESGSRVTAPDAAKDPQPTAILPTSLDNVPSVEPSQVHSLLETTKNSKVAMIPLPQQSPLPDKQIEEVPQPPPPTPASVTSSQDGAKEPNRGKKHILFTTKIGSKEEQLFQTQFSVSKTESLCSPTSDANNGQSDNASNLSDERTRNSVVDQKQKNVSHQPSSEDRTAEDLPQDCPVPGSPSVIVQMPQSAMTRRTSSQLRCAFSTDDEMSLGREAPAPPPQPNVIAQIQEQAEKDVAVMVEETATRQRSTEAMDYKLGPQRTSTTEENAMASSGSERDSETCTDTTTRSRKQLPHNLAIDEHEATGLVSQVSYEEELPYVPTSLPEERAVGIPMISVKERATMEVKTYPVERPRSTTPLNPSFIDDYCGAEVDTPTTQKGEKLKISLPRKDSRDKIQKPKSPRRVSNSSGKSWFEYEARGEHTDQFEEPPPPPLPPRAPTAHTAATTTTTTAAHSQWINFENIPEKRKPPKRITTVPHKETPAGDAQATTVYQFVKPDECQCECHEHDRKVAPEESATTSSDADEAQQPLLSSGSGMDEGCMR